MLHRLLVETNQRAPGTGEILYQTYVTDMETNSKSVHIIQITLHPDLAKESA